MVCADSPTWTCVCNHAKSAHGLLNIFTHRSRLRIHTCSSECVFAQVSRDTTHAITYALCKAARNMYLPQEAEQELIFCANILLEKEKPWCIQLSCIFNFTCHSLAELHPSTLLPVGSQQTCSRHNFYSIPKRQERTRLGPAPPPCC